MSNRTHVVFLVDRNEMNNRTEQVIDEVTKALKEGRADVPVRVSTYSFSKRLRQGLAKKTKYKTHNLNENLLATIEEVGNNYEIGSGEKTVIITFANSFDTNYNQPLIEVLRQSLSCQNYIYKWRFGFVGKEARELCKYYFADPNVAGVVTAPPLEALEVLNMIVGLIKE